jgi:hypothetical protein
MRVPVLNNDLPTNFTKVARYLGRHWPQGKLPLNKSRECLAYLMGYNSVHELNKVSMEASLPKSIDMNSLYASMLVKALYKYRLNPRQLMRLLYKTPFKELSFYNVTNIAIEKRFLDDQRKKGKILIRDEWNDLCSYSTPKVMIAQNKNHSVPPYSYAIRPDGKFFNSWEYEHLINSLGDIQGTVDEIDNGLTAERFIQDYITPLAWGSINNYVDDHTAGEYSWHPPYMVTVYIVKLDQDKLGYLLYHQGLNAFYPTIYKNEQDLVQSILKLYKCELLEEDPLFPPQDLNLCQSDISTLKSYDRWCNEDFTNYETIYFDGQRLIRANPLKAYTQLYSNPLLIGFNAPYSLLSDIPESLIKPEIYTAHKRIEYMRSNTLIEVQGEILHMKANEVSEIFEFVFSGLTISFIDIINAEYDEDYEESTDDIEQWNRVGQGVQKHYPELTPFFDLMSLGYTYSDYEQLVNNCRYTFSCTERDVLFLGYALTRSPNLIKSRLSSQDDMLAGVLMISHSSEHLTKSSFDSLKQNYNQVVRMLSLHRDQGSNISDIEKYVKHMDNKDPLYLSHGNLTTLKENSNNEIFGELMKYGRKTNTPSIIINETPIN